MKLRFAALLLSALALALSSPVGSFQAGEKKKHEIEGVKGTVYVINGSKHKDTKLTVRPHDAVIIEYTYPISPPFPVSAHQKSSNAEAVKGVGVSRVVYVQGPLGVGRLSGSFLAHQQGKATLSFDVSHGKDSHKITCEVEVK